MRLINRKAFAGGGGGYILDTYSADFAYGFRQLKTGVTNVARLIRLSDNAESDFTESDFSDGTVTTWIGASTARLVTFYDQSGSGFDISPTSGASSTDRIKVYTVSGDWVAASEGSNYNAVSAALNGSVDISTFSLFSVALWSGSSQANERPYALGTTPDDGAPTFGLAGDASIRFDNGSLGGSQSITSGSLTQRSSVAASGSVDDWISGVSNISSGSLGGRSFTDLFYIGDTRQSGYAGAGIAEAIGFLSDESANRTAIESDQATAYGL
jgi:hypothetical protein